MKLPYSIPEFYSLCCRADEYRERREFVKRPKPLGDAVRGNPDITTGTLQECTTRYIVWNEPVYPEAMKEFMETFKLDKKSSVAIVHMVASDPNPSLLINVKRGYYLALRQLVEEERRKPKPKPLWYIMLGRMIDWLNKVLEDKDTTTSCG